MAYARGVAAGFEMDGMDDLISFANAFGALRLREACNSCKELWKKKHGDGLWMAELAAVKASAPPDMSLLDSSGIVLTNEVAALSLNGTDSKPDTKAVPAFGAPMAWPNHVPQYFYPFQQPPPYQGYPYPPMQPHENRNMSRLPKGKSYKKKGSEDFKGDHESSDSSESDSASDDSTSSLEDQGKRRSRSGKDYCKSTKNRKKSSKTVIIRNINYITPDGKNQGMEGDELTDNIYAKESVDAIVGILGKENRTAARQGSSDDVVKGTPEGRQGNENWDAFQNILMNHDEKSVDEAANLRSMDVGEEHFTLRSSTLGAKSEGLRAKEKIPVDSSLVTQRSIENVGGVAFKHFESNEGVRRLPRAMDSADEFMLLPNRSETLGNGSKYVNYSAGAEKLVIKSGNGEDWFVADHVGELKSYRQPTSLDDNCIFTSEGYCNARVGESRKQELVDDSFMVQSSLAGDDLYDSRWRPDISIAADLAQASDMENGHANPPPGKRESFVGMCEPNYLYMIPERNSGAVNDSSLAFDDGIDLSVVEANAARLSSVKSCPEEIKSASSSGKKSNSKNTDARAKPRIPGRPQVRNRTEAMSKTAKKSSLASRTVPQKSKFEKEEEMRKRVEAVARERQKRIAERTAMVTSRRASLDSRIAERTAMVASRRASLDSTTGKGSATSAPSPSSRTRTT